MSTELTDTHVSNVESDSDAQAAGDDQGRKRLVITVPNPDTLFVLGSRHWDQKGYDGIAGITTRHILFSASSSDSTATLETPGQVVLQSTGSTLTAFAKSDVLVGSAGDDADANNPGRTYVSARGSVFVAAGVSGPVHPSVGIFTAAKPSDSVPLDQMRGHLAAVKSKVDNVIYTTEMSMISLAVLGLAFGKVKDAASLGVGIAQLLIAGLSKTLTPNYKGAVLTYGQESVTIASGKDIHVACIGTITMMTPEFASISAGIQAGMTGLLSAGVTGGFTASLTGYFKSEMLGGKVVMISSRRGTVTMQGQDITVGTVLPPFPQSGTQHLHLNARKAIEQKVGKTTTNATSLLDTHGLTVTGTMHTLTAKKATSIAAGMMSLRVSSDRIALVRSAKEIFNELVKEANATYEAAKSAADATWDKFQAARSALEERIGYFAARKAAGEAWTVYKSALDTARRAQDRALEAAAKLPSGILRIAVSKTKAEMSNGLSAITVDSSGAITIDGKGMPVTIKTGGSQIVLNGVTVTSKPMITMG